MRLRLSGCAGSAWTTERGGPQVMPAALSGDRRRPEAALQACQVSRLWKVGAEVLRKLLCALEPTNAALHCFGRVTAYPKLANGENVPPPPA